MRRDVKRRRRSALDALCPGRCTPEALRLWLLGNTSRKRPSLTMTEVRAKTPAHWDAGEIERAMSGLLAAGIVANTSGRLWLRAERLRDSLREVHNERPQKKRKAKPGICHCFMCGRDVDAPEPLCMPPHLRELGAKRNQQRMIEAGFSVVPHPDGGIRFLCPDCSARELQTLIH